jgi:CubicO group peptidase (beta-lactamase class C family)
MPLLQHGLSLAAFLVEAASGTAVDRWCDRRIFSAPRDARHGVASGGRGSVRRRHAYRYIAYRDLFRPYGQYGYPDYPDGELRATSTDLARHLMSFMNDGRHGGTRVLARSTVEESHTGGDWGVATRMFFRPRDEVGVIVLTNGTPSEHGWTALRDVEIRLFAESGDL